MEGKKRRLLIGCRAGIKPRLKKCLPYGHMSPVLSRLIVRELPKVRDLKISTLSHTMIDWDERVYITVTEEIYDKISSMVPSRMKTAVLSSIIEDNIDTIEALSLSDLKSLEAPGDPR